MDWPGNLEAANALFDRMPPTLLGEPLHRPGFFGSAAGLVYGRGRSAPMAWVMASNSPGVAS